MNCELFPFENGKALEAHYLVKAQQSDQPGPCRTASVEVEWVSTSRKPSSTAPSLVPPAVSGRGDARARKFRRRSRRFRERRGPPGLVDGAVAVQWRWAEAAVLRRPPQPRAAMSNNGSPNASAAGELDSSPVPLRSMCIGFCTAASR